MAAPPGTPRLAVSPLRGPIAPELPFNSPVPSPATVLVVALGMMFCSLCLAGEAALPGCLAGDPEY